MRLSIKTDTRRYPGTKWIHGGAMVGRAAAKLGPVADLAATISAMASSVRGKGIANRRNFSYLSVARKKTLKKKENYIRKVSISFQYQETMKQMSAQGLTGIAPIPLTPMGQPPPLPKEDTSVKPPLPPDNTAQNFTGIPPPHQNNLPLFPSKRSANPPLPPGQPPMPAENNKRSANSNAETGSVKKIRGEDDELTEAEKTFDAQFKQWEEQFNKWKQQNANHPDKVSEIKSFFAIYLNKILKDRPKGIVTQ